MLIFTVNFATNIFHDCVTILLRKRDSIANADLRYLISDSLNLGIQFIDKVEQSKVLVLHWGRRRRERERERE